MAYRAGGYVSYLVIERRTNGLGLTTVSESFFERKMPEITVIPKEIIIILRFSQEMRTRVRNRREIGETKMIVMQYRWAEAGIGLLLSRNAWACRGPGGPGAACRCGTDKAAVTALN